MRNALKMLALTGKMVQKPIETVQIIETNSLLFGSCCVIIVPTDNYRSIRSMESNK